MEIFLLVMIEVFTKIWYSRFTYIVIIYMSIDCLTFSVAGTKYSTCYNLKEERSILAYVLDVLVLAWWAVRQ